MSRAFSALCVYSKFRHHPRHQIPMAIQMCQISFLLQPPLLSSKCCFGTTFTTTRCHRKQERPAVFTTGLKQIQTYRCNYWQATSQSNAKLCRHNYCPPHLFTGSTLPCNIKCSLYHCITSVQNTADLFLWDTVYC